MRRSRKAWWLVGVGVLLSLVAFDLGRRALAPAEVLSTPPETPRAAPFNVGEKAPDFTLPDRFGKPHRLADLVKRDTLLTFICGCANCIDLQTFTGLMVKRLGPKAPELITVTTMPVEREDTYFRDTQLKQLLLYEKKEGPVVESYQGHPCPRAFRLRGDRTVAWIGSSPRELQQLQALGLELAANLGFSQAEVLTIQSAPPVPPR